MELRFAEISNERTQMRPRYGDLYSAGLCPVKLNGIQNVQSIMISNLYALVHLYILIGVCVFNQKQWYLKVRSADLSLVAYDFLLYALLIYNLSLCMLIISCSLSES